MKQLTKVMATSVLMISAGAASAGQFYIDNGVDFAPDTTIPTKVNATSTSLKNELTFKYQSSTNIDFGLDGVLSVGDSITTSGGLAVGPIFENEITSLNPGQGLFGSGFADNGFKSNWALSFTFSNLVGTVVGFDGAFPLLSYTGGTIEMLYTLDGLNFSNFMNLEVQSSALIGGANLQLNGLVDFTGVDPTYQNLFRLPDGTPFAAISGLEIVFEVDQNTNPSALTTVITPIDGGINISSNHDGSVTFNANAVPEPTSLALLGFGLLGFASRFGRKTA